MMSALISDVLEGRVTPGICNAACNAGGKLPKVVDMQQRYGQLDGNNARELILFPEENKMPALTNG